MDYQYLLTTISGQYSRLLGENLIGIYVHGSIAFGCFDWNRSDIDFIVVVDKPVPQAVKLQLLQILVDLNKQAPSKGFEMSVVLRRVCEDFVHPTPYELHFSNDWLANYLEDPLSVCNDDYKTDFDLAAHFTVIVNVGIVLCGEAIDKVFGTIPKDDYLDSICKDIENAKEDVVHYPVYVILNLCRVYAYIKDGLVLSKEKGGQWGLANLQVQYCSLITSMLNNYANGEPFVSDNDLQIDFCEYMINLIFAPNSIKNLL